MMTLIRLLRQRPPQERFIRLFQLLVIPPLAALYYPFYRWGEVKHRLRSREGR